MKLLGSLTLAIIIFTSTALAGAGTGVDSILDETGLEKPLDWNSWTQTQKFSWLQERGLYPERGRKYQGEVGSLDQYFDWLGVDQPENWYRMSVDERKAFVASVQHESVQESDVDKELVFEQFSDGNISDDQTKPFPIEKTIVLIFLALFAIASFLPSTSKIRSFSRQTIYMGFPVILLILSMINAQHSFFRFLGEWAEWSLVFLLLIKPIAVILRSSFLKRAVYYRRELGLLSFWLFVFHATGFIIIKNMSVQNVLSTPYLWWGVLAGITMLVLAITSNNKAASLLKRNWKRVQYFAYPALLLVLAHSSLAMTGNLNKFYLISSIFLVLKIVEFVLVKKRSQK